MNQLAPTMTVELSHREVMALLNATVNRLEVAIEAAEQDWTPTDGGGC